MTTPPTTTTTHCDTPASTPPVDAMAYDVLHHAVSQLRVAYGRRANAATTRAEEIYWSAKMHGLELMETRADMANREEMLDIASYIGREIVALGGVAGENEGGVYRQ